MKREWLMLAGTFDGSFIPGVFVSEKLDGVRAFWDGGVTRGLLEVPYSNDSHVSTGLWSRYGNVLHAPNWWLDRLPRYPLDGELWIRHNAFQETVSVVRRHTPSDEDWKSVHYKVFDSPSMRAVLDDGRINNPNDKRQITSAMYDWWRNRGGKDLVPFGTHFIESYNQLKSLHVDLVEQREERVSINCDSLPDHVEGLMIRYPYSTWEPRRTNTLLKAKRLRQDTAVVNYVTGGKGKHNGRIGSINVTNTAGATFDISGFTDEQRTVSTILQPDKQYSYHVGRTMLYAYRDLTDSGKPKEARFLKWQS